MTTTDIVIELAKRLDVSQRQARHILELHVKAIIEQLAAGRSVMLRGFGTIGVKETAERRAYVPSADAICEIPAHRKVHFRAAKGLREYVSGWRPQ